MFAEDVHKQIKKKKKKRLDGASFYSLSGVSDIMERTDADPVKVGKLLFEVVAWCKDHNVELESSLRRYTQRIIDAIESKGRFSLITLLESNRNVLLI